MQRENSWAISAGRTRARPGARGAPLSGERRRGRTRLQGVHQSRVGRIPDASASAICWRKAGVSTRRTSASLLRKAGSPGRPDRSRSAGPRDPRSSRRDRRSPSWPANAGTAYGRGSHSNRQAIARLRFRPRGHGLKVAAAQARRNVGEDFRAVSVAGAESKWMLTKRSAFARSAMAGRSGKGTLKSVRRVRITGSRPRAAASPGERRHRA